MSAADVQIRYPAIRSLPRGSAALLTDGGCLRPSAVREALLARFARLGGSAEAGAIRALDDRGSFFAMEIQLHVRAAPLGSSLDPPDRGPNLQRSSA